MNRNSMRTQTLAMAILAAMLFLAPLNGYAIETFNDFLKDTTYVKADGQNVSMVSYNDANVKYTYSGIAVNFTAHVVENNVTITTPAANDGDWFTAFCVDPFQYAKIGGTLGVDLVAPSAVQGGLQAAWLFENYYKKDPSTVAALQVAIWETVVDYDKAYNLKTGDFYITKLNGIAAPSATVTNTTWTLADSMLTDLQQNFNAKDLDYIYRISKTGTNQDFIIQLHDPPPAEAAAPGAGTPEPGTMILMGIGLIGLAGFKKFRKN